MFKDKLKSSYSNFKKNKLKPLFSYCKKEKKKIIKSITKHLIIYSSILLIVYTLILYLIFFNFTFEPSITQNTADNLIVINDINQIRNITNFQTYLGTDRDEQINSYQPINIIIITNKNISDIFNSINWVEDITFLDTNITFKEYYSLYKNNTLPVINLYLNNKTQDYSYQSISDTISKREHIRLWKFGYLNNSENKIYLASISNDDGFTLSYYSDFIVPIHSFNPDIDSSRDLFLELLNQSNQTFDYKYLNWTESNTQLIHHHHHNMYYFTNGKILLLNI